MKLSMQAVPFTPTPKDAVSGPTTGKWIVSVDGTPFCYAYLFTSPKHDDLERWWVIPLKGALNNNPTFINKEGEWVSNMTLRNVRLTDWVIEQVEARRALLTQLRAELENADADMLKEFL